MKKGQTGRLRPLGAALLVLVLVAGGGIWGIQRYVAYEQARDLDHWRARLDLLADDRLADVHDWLDRNFALLAELADNASLQLYLAQLAETARGESGRTPPAETAQAGYLRNLLTATAQRAGLGGARPAVPANLRTPHPGGLALFAPDGRLLVATPGFPMPSDRERRLARQAAARNKPLLGDIHEREDGSLSLEFLAPVPPVPGAERAQPVGAILLSRSPWDGLYPLLLRKTAQEGHETLLVAAREGMAVYLSPQADGTAPLQRRFPLDADGLAAVHAIQRPGTFGLFRDYAGRPVLVTSRRVRNTPWILMQKADAAAALRETRQHARFLYLTFSLVLLLGLVLVVAAWRHGSSRRAERLAAELEEKTRQLENQRRLLQTVTDHIDDYILLLDAQYHVVFANLPLARLLGLEPGQLAGKSLASVLGPGTARQLLPCLKESGERHAPHLLRLALGDREGIYQCLATPVPDCVQADRLLVLHDVTALQEAERRRARLFDQLLAALMRAIDRHDPWSAGHSERTARVARAIAEEMNLSASETEALVLAARLANIGKILVPKEILTKTTPLTEEEQAVLRRHVEHAVDILSQIEFEGPVVEIIAQKQEHMDGSGYPKGLKNGEILLGARILAVANTFVALVSPRAYREAVDIETALERLLADTPAKYDRHVVAALFHVAENVLRPEDLLGEAPEDSGEG